MRRCAQGVGSRDAFGRHRPQPCSYLGGKLPALSCPNPSRKEGCPVSKAEISAGSKTDRYRSRKPFAGSKAVAALRRDGIRRRTRQPCCAAAQDSETKTQV